MRHNARETWGEGSYRIANIEFSNIDLSPEDLSIAETHAEIVHSRDYLNELMIHSDFESPLAEISMSKDTYTHALSAVSLSIMAAQPLLEEKEGKFALVRPPGHHASKEKAEGFCLLNNVACATEYLVLNGMRMAILDIDLHHGNGTQSIFYDRPDVLYVSIHNCDIYPHTGHEKETGNGLGKGFTINYPVSGKLSSEKYLAILQKAMNDIIVYAPEAIAVSVGFDTYRQDRLNQGMWDLELDDFGEIGRLIKRANIPFFCVLEGGYHHDIDSCLKKFVNGSK